MIRYSVATRHYTPHGTRSVHRPCRTKREAERHYREMSKRYDFLGGEMRKLDKPSPFQTTPTKVKKRT